MKTDNELYSTYPKSCETEEIKEWNSCNAHIVTLEIRAVSYLNVHSVQQTAKHQLKLAPFIILNLSVQK